MPASSASIPATTAARIARCRTIVNDTLLAARDEHGVWVGELSASALSTATAVCALATYVRRRPDALGDLGPLIDAGLAWLADHQNDDGGWGDTVKSFSNISTTTLVWAVFGLFPEWREGHGDTVARVERWLSVAAGSLEPEQLVRAIEARYGEDRTFSIPILTMCAICGRLGESVAGWQRVRPLPFELAVLPRKWFGRIGLPVVSYALPALIAIGQVRHHFAPPENSLVRLWRDRARGRTLRLLANLQPVNGGFLEATPLTSFVSMSLIAMGLTEDPTVQKALSFLRQSARADGSWPIDTNLSTWVTTLAINSLGDDHQVNDLLATEDQARLLRWLSEQQYRDTHPYTLAAPGGWAWTNLPGGVPDADDTAGALLALHRLGRGRSETREAAERGVDWLLALQNRDGGIPTFCRGWGKLPFDRSSPDLTAHALRAFARWQTELSPELSPGLASRVRSAAARAIGFLERTQGEDGEWIPLWFGHQESPDDENPLYGTAKVLIALAEARSVESNVRQMISRGARWLLDHQQPDGAWSGARAGRVSVEETALALEALLAIEAGTNGDTSLEGRIGESTARGFEWLCDRVEDGTWTEPSPIGFYFAKLWYFERAYPLVCAAAAFNRTAFSELV